jgi:hypothetical protein
MSVVILVFRMVVWLPMTLVMLSLWGRMSTSNGAASRLITSLQMPNMDWQPVAQY